MSASLQTTVYIDKMIKIHTHTHTHGNDYKSGQKKGHLEKKDMGVLERNTQQASEVLAMF